MSHYAKKENVLYSVPALKKPDGLHYQTHKHHSYKLIDSKN